MDFDFSEEQRLLRDTLRDLLRRHCTAADVRAMWADPAGRSPQRWQKLAEIGILGITVPAEFGGHGGDEIDLVLLLEEAGRAALPEPLLEHTALGTPLLARAGTQAQRAAWLPQLAAGAASVTVGLESSPWVADATADLVILERGGALHALTRDRITLEPRHSVDRARRLFSVTAEIGPDTLMGPSEPHRRWILDHGAAATAAELVGVAGALLDRTVDYVRNREQFGRAVGSFQAVQHKLAEVYLLVESSRSAVYYAAYALAGDLPDASVAASVAKAYATEAERRANHEALQLHGGVGFTWENDLHLWLKRGTALEAAYGDADTHRSHIARWIYPPAEGGDERLPPTQTSGVTGHSVAAQVRSEGAAR